VICDIAWHFALTIGTGGRMTNEVQILLDDVPNRKLLKPVEVAGFLGVSAKTIYRWCDMGLMESFKLNGSVRVLRASVLSFLLKGDSSA
jgi:predicted DNA-binding transcriptional regulator AlpA